MIDQKPTRLDKILDIRRIAKYLKGDARFRQDMESKIDQVEGSLQPSRDMIKSHLDFLDFLTEESRREHDDSGYHESGPGGRDYRVEFVTWYLQHKRGPRYRAGGPI